MARSLRIEFEGALYHVTSRGNERRRIVRDDADRIRRLEWRRRTVETYGWHLHAFVLMDSHDHLYVETLEANLSGGLRGRGFRPHPQSTRKMQMVHVARTRGAD